MARVDPDIVNNGLTVEEMDEIDDFALRQMCASVHRWREYGKSQSGFDYVWPFGHGRGFFDKFPRPDFSLYYKYWFEPPVGAVAADPARFVAFDGPFSELRAADPAEVCHELLW